MMKTSPVSSAAPIGKPEKRPVLVIESKFELVFSRGDLLVRLAHPVDETAGDARVGVRRQLTQPLLRLV